MMDRVECQSLCLAGAPLIETLVITGTAGAPARSAGARCPQRYQGSRFSRTAGEGARVPSRRGEPHGSKVLQRLGGELAFVRTSFSRLR